MMKRGGWYGDRHRHYLAAKGIRTSRYKYYDTKSQAEMIQNVMSSRPKEVEDPEMAELNRRSDMQREKFTAGLDAAERDGLIDPIHTTRILQKPADLEGQFRQRMMDPGEFMRRSDELLAMELKINAKGLGDPFKFEDNGGRHGI